MKTLKLSDEQINYILSLMGKRPYEECFIVLQEIQRQFMEQEIPPLKED